MLQHQRGELRERRVSGRQREVLDIRGNLRPRIARPERRQPLQFPNAHRRIADRLVLPDRVERIRRSMDVSGGFRNVQRVAAPAVSRRQFGEVRQVDVRTKHIQVRGARAPDIVHVSLWAAAGVIARPFVPRPIEPGVHEHRNGVLALARLGHLVHVAGIVPAHENLVCLDALSEDFLPGSRGLEAGALPDRPELRQQAVLVLLKKIHELPGHGFRESLVGRRRAVARIAQQSNFVLHLRHDRAAILVHLANMAHQRRERPRIRPRVVLAERREGLDALAVLDLGPRKAVLLPLHPGGREVRLPVLPTAEPQPGDPEIVLVGIGDGRIGDAEVVLTLLRLDPGPRYRNQHRIQVNLAGQYREDPLHVGEVRRRCVGQLPGERQKWFAVHNQLCRRAPLLQVGDGLRIRRSRQQRAQ